VVKHWAAQRHFHLTRVTVGFSRRLSQDRILEDTYMHRPGRWLLPIVVLVLSVLATAPVAFGQSDHVRWDIASLDFSTTPATANPDGEAFATFEMADTHLKIRFTGNGTFVAPASGGTSGAVAGGGDWETFVDDVSTGSGTYQVTKLVSWEFANFQTPGTIIDHIGDVNERASGNAVFLIEYSDGSQGTLVIGCHGPGAPDGIFEGVTATKGYVTYWNPQAPQPNVDANRTLFHLRMSRHH
jgi:hypothetical protein